MMCQHEKLEIASMILGMFSSDSDCDQPESVKCPDCHKYKSGECDPKGTDYPLFEQEYTLAYDIVRKGLKMSNLRHILRKDKS